MGIFVFFLEQEDAVNGFDLTFPPITEPFPTQETDIGDDARTPPDSNIALYGNLETHML